MAIQAGPAERGEKEIQTKWPVEEGLTGGTQKQEGRQINLVAEGIDGIKSIVPKKEKVGLD